MYSDYNLEELLNKKTKENKKLIFIHTPKCAGTYVSSILSHLKIENKGHNKAVKGEGITFTVIRDPIERFESLLNYRLSEGTPRSDWPSRLGYVYHSRTTRLNEIISKMSDKEILNFSPFKTLKYWTRNVDIIITIENLDKLLGYFGYVYDKAQFDKKNVSNKVNGKLNEESINRLKNLYKDDIEIYNKVVNSTLQI